MSTRIAERFRLYEIAVTNAAMLARFCKAVAPRSARILREDFSGTGALARAWADLSRDHRAIAIDKDANVLRHAATHPRLSLKTRDVLLAPDRADIIAATNFALGYWHTRRDLVAYLAHARSCLTPAGILIADMYGGSTAFDVGTQRRRIADPAGGYFWYEWEQRVADAPTGRVFNAIHFEIPRNAKRERAFPSSSPPFPRTIRNAFTYDWRLWSIPELREAALDAGFHRVDAYTSLGDAMDQHGNLYPRPLAPGESLDADWVVYLVAHHKKNRPRNRGRSNRSS